MDEHIEEKQEEIVLATIASVGQNGVTIIIDGNEEAGEKEYKVNSGQKFAAGDRVKILKDSGTYLVEYVIGSPMSRYPIPSGGTDGQVLVKDGATNYKVKWVKYNGIPSGGITNQVLTKSAVTDYYTKWETPHYIPAGGSAGQVLRKLTSVDYAVYWANI